MGKPYTPASLGGEKDVSEAKPGEKPVEKPKKKGKKK
jgi:hypothetical protein